MVIRSVTVTVVIISPPKKQQIQLLFHQMVDGKLKSFIIHHLKQTKLLLVNDFDINCYTIVNLKRPSSE
jgi:hypothetical protein